MVQLGQRAVYGRPVRFLEIFVCSVVESQFEIVLVLKEDDLKEEAWCPVFRTMKYSSGVHMTDSE
jgi:hypothetical protein